MYTGRKIAILADVHGMLEPLEAILEDLKKKGITEIYSLGDNIGEGPNPQEVIELLEKYNVKSISGNAEDYLVLGTTPFEYLNYNRVMDVLKTSDKLSPESKGIIEMYPHSREIFIGGEKVGLVHFPNDVRFDFSYNSTWSYQNNIANNKNGFEQFFYTNSIEQKEFIKNIVSKYGLTLEQIKEIIALRNATKSTRYDYDKGILSAYNEPLLNGQTLDKFDAIFAGHVHFRIYEDLEKTKFLTVRAAGMGNSYQNYRGITLPSKYQYDEPRNSASYVILHEKDNGFDVENVLVEYDYEKMLYAIVEDNSPIIKFVSAKPYEIEEIRTKLSK